METSPLLSLAVLLVGAFDEPLDCYRRALEDAGVAVFHVARVADLERWPRDHVVICAADYATPWWKQVGARHLIVIGESAAGLGHADRVLPSSIAPVHLVTAVLACRH